MIKSVVCIRPLADSAQVRVDREGRLTARETAGMNPDDKAAVEAALRLREAEGGTVTLLCAGPASAAELLREALAMGCDEATLTAVPAPGAAEAETAASALKAALQHQEYDLILTGGQAMDSDIAQTGPLLAEALGLPQLIQAGTLRLKGRRLAAQCSLGSREVLLEAPLPCLVTVTDKLAAPRYTTFTGIAEAYARPLRHLEHQKTDKALRVKTLVNRQRGRKGILLREQPPEKAAEQLLSFLRTQGLL